MNPGGTGVEELLGRALVPYSERPDAEAVARLVDDLITRGQTLYAEVAAIPGDRRNGHAGSALAEWAYFVDSRPARTRRPGELEPRPRPGPHPAQPRHHPERAAEQGPVTGRPVAILGAGVATPAPGPMRWTFHSSRRHADLVPGTSVRSDTVCSRPSQPATSAGGAAWGIKTTKSLLIESFP